MGIFTSLLLPILKAGATIGASAIPGAGPVLGPIVGGALTAGQGLASGQGPLTSLSQGAISGGMAYGMGQLGDYLNAPEGTADTSQFQHQYSMVDPGMAGGSGDPLLDWSVRDLNQTMQQKLMQRNSFMIGGGGFGF